MRCEIRSGLPIFFFFWMPFKKINVVKEDFIFLDDICILGKPYATQKKGYTLVILLEKIV